MEELQKHWPTIFNFLVSWLTVQVHTARVRDRLLVSPLLRSLQTGYENAGEEQVEWFQIPGPVQLIWLTARFLIQISTVLKGLVNLI
jgi:hypothetical protein